MLNEPSLIKAVEALGYDVFPTWCDHIKHRELDKYGNMGWVISYKCADKYERIQYQVNYQCWKFCPVCGKEKPKD